MATIVIPSWRRADLLRVCLESVAGQLERRFRVVVVSSGGGGEVAAVAREFAGRFDCAVLELAANHGFARAVNAGLAAVNTEFAAVLNDDVRLDPDWLGTLREWMESHPETGFAAGTIYSADGSLVDNLGDALSRGGAAWRLGHGTAVPCAPEPGPRPLLAASWTAVLLRKSLLETVGNLDEQFGSYLEDIEFAVRCVRAGARGALLPRAVCWHHGGASSGGEQSAAVFRQLTRNRKLLLVKSFPRELRSEFRPEISSTGWLWLGLALRQGRLLAWLGGQLDYLRALPEAARQPLRWDAASLARFREWLLECEQAIYADQFGAGRRAADTFWRWYFALAGKPAAGAARHGGAGAVSESPTRQP